jgi:PAS domain S-box-containing protein
LIYHVLWRWLSREQTRTSIETLEQTARHDIFIQVLFLPVAIIFAQLYSILGAWSFVLGGSVTVLLALLHRLGETSRDLEKRLRELHSLNRIGQTLAANLELDALLDTLYRQISQLMEADYFYIALYDATTNRLSFPLIFEEGKRKRYPSRPARDGLTEHVIRRRESILIPANIEQSISDLGLELIGDPPLSWLGAPLLVGEKVLGVITVQSFRHAYAYSQEDKELLSTLATQAAIALEKAQLYGYTRRRASELALLNTISTAVTATLDLEQVLQIIVTSVMPLAACQKSALLLLDSTTGELELAASEGPSSNFEPSPRIQNSARKADLMTVADVMDSELSAAEIKTAQQEGYRAFAELSLIAQNERIGVLCLYYNHRHHIDLAERDLLTTFANQAATAIANARLYSQTDQALARRVEELSAIERIGRELSSTLEPQQVLDLVLEQAMLATGATHGCIAMLEEGERVNIVSHRGYAPEAIQNFVENPQRLHKGIIGHVIQQGELSLIYNVTQAPTYVSLDSSIQSELAVPILREGKVLGAINLESQELNGFDQQDAAFISQLAIQAAIAWQNAQLFQERSQRVEELSLLYQASLALASSLKYKDILDVISRLARHITNSDTVTLYLFDAARDRFERVSTQGYRAEETRPSTIRRGGVARTVVETGQPVFISDTTSYPNINPLVLERGIRSLIAMPIMSQGQVLGVLYVNDRQPNAYTKNDLQLVSALANQAGATIANISLFRQVSEARDRLEAIINSTKEGILVLDNVGRVVIANSRMASFSSLTREQLAGRTLDELMEKHAAKLPRLFSLKEETLQDWTALNKVSESSTHVFQLQVSDSASPGEMRSRSRFTELFNTPVLDEREQVIGRLMVFRDITEEKELERMRQDLTSMMVHDLRSPLTAVLSGLEIIDETIVKPSQDALAMQAMEVAERSCQNMLTLVNSLLEINQMEAGQMPLERAPAPFAPLARSVVSRLSPLANEHQVAIQLELPSGLPMVDMDNEKIGRVLLNLLDNALKFSPEGGQVTLKAAYPNGETGDVLLCSVSDTGPGIPEDYQEKVFDRFIQVKNQAAPKGPRGSGLGLAFCKLAVEAHEGRIWLESEPGQGSTFHFTLPVADIEAWLDD